MSALPIQQNPTLLTPRQSRAVELVVADELSDEAIAAEIGVGRDTLWRWKKLPAFAAEVAQLRETFRQQAMDRAVFADKRARVVALNGIATDLMAQMSRAEYQTILKVTEDGEHIYGFDIGRAKEFREYLDDIAIEVGDRKKDATTAVNVAVKVYTDPRMENPIEADWHDAPPPRSSADL